MAPRVTPVARRVTRGARSAPVYWTADPKKDKRVQELLDIKEWVNLWHDFNKKAVANATATPTEVAAMGFCPPLLFRTNACGIAPPLARHTLPVHTSTLRCPCPARAAHQLLFDTQCCITGFLGLLEDLERRHKTGCRLIARKLTQDALESLFGRLRQALGGKREVSMKDAATSMERMQTKSNSKARRTREDKKRKKARNQDQGDDARAAAVAAAGAIVPVATPVAAAAPAREKAWCVVAYGW